MKNLAPRIYQIEFYLELLNNVKDILINDFQNASIIPPDTITVNDHRIESLRQGHFQLHFINFIDSFI